MDLPQLPDSIRNNVVLTYSAVIDRSRRAMGTRLMAISTSSEKHPVSQAVLALSEAMPKTHQFTIVAPFGMEYDEGLLSIAAPRTMILEIPILILMDTAVSEMVLKLADRGMRLAVRGRSDSPINPKLLPVFEYSLIGVNEDRRKGPPPPGVSRSLKFLMTGAESVESVDEAFMRGAAATIGWPLNQLIHPNTKGMQSSQAAVLKLLALVNEEAEYREIEQVLKIEPTIAYKMLNLINSPSFGLSRPVASFQQAIMLLGHRKLMRWLALLMTSSSKEVNSIPIMHASVRRGLFLECFGGDDSEKKDALFITGAFSLLDKMTMTPLLDIFKTISVAPNIVEAIVNKTGPLGGYLQLIEAIEKGIPSKIFNMQKTLGVSAAQCNDALIHALWNAEQLDQSLD